jgi:hypothetical protein
MIDGCAKSRSLKVGKERRASKISIQPAYRGGWTNVVDFVESNVTGVFDVLLLLSVSRWL